MPSRGSGRRCGEIGRIVAVSARFTLHEPCCKYMKQQPSAVGCLLESTPPPGLENGAGARADNKGCMVSSTSPHSKKYVIPFQAGREYLNDSAGSGRHCS